jgi:hypothetical protein
MTLILGDVRRAAANLEETRSIARRIGVAGFIRWQEAEYVFYCYWEGRWDDALHAVDDFFRTIEGAQHYMEGMARDIRAMIWLARGEPVEALAEARLATELSRPAKDPQTLNPALAYQASVALSAGDRSAADALADELVELWSVNGIRQPIELAVAPWVFRALGRSAELLYALDHEALGATPWHEAARLIASGDLAAGAEVFARIGSVPDEAYTRLRAAEASLAGGDRAEADRQLGLALPVFARLGASAWTAEAESLLAESA